MHSSSPSPIKSAEQRWHCSTTDGKCWLLMMTIVSPQCYHVRLNLWLLLHQDDISLSSLHNVPQYLFEGNLFWRLYLKEEDYIVGSSHLQKHFLLSTTVKHKLWINHTWENVYAVDFHEQFQSCIFRKLEINFIGKLLGGEKVLTKLWIREDTQQEALLWAWNWGFLEAVFGVV